MFLEHHIFHLPVPTFILVGVPLHALLRGTDNGECLKIAVGRQEFLASFARAVNHAAEYELEEDLLQEMMASTLEEELSLPCLDLSFAPLLKVFNQCLNLLHKDFLPHSGR
jgi:hypothetical protein